MKAKHTPGPWYAVNYARYWTIQDSPYYEGNIITDENKHKKAPENAKLAAAAPDLLEALQDVYDNDGKVNAALFSKIHAAIKKATE